MFDRVALEQVEHGNRRRGVKLSRRLVEHEHARLQREHRRDRDLLLLTTGKLGDAPVAQVGDAHSGERLVDPRGNLSLRHAEVLQAVEHLVFDHRRHHLRVDVLAHASDQAAYVRERRFARIDPVDADAAVEIAWVAVRDDAVDRVGERRLPAARGTRDADERAVGDGEVDPLEDGLGPLPIAKR